MLGFIFLTISLWAWYVILRRHIGSMVSHPLVLLALTVPLNFGSLGILSSLFMILHFSIANSFLFAVAFILLLALTSYRKKDSAIFATKKPYNRYILVMWAVTFLLLLQLMLNTLVEAPDGSLITPTPVSTADSSYHLHQVLRFQQAKYWDFTEADFSGEFIRYPYIINFISGVLMKFDMPLPLAYHLPLLLAAAAALFLFLELLKELDMKRSLLLPVFLIAFFASGLGYINYPDSKGFTPLYRAYSVYPMENIAYAGLIPGLLPSQRTFSLGLGLALASIILVCIGLKKQKKEPFIFAGLAYGFLPLSHTHSFLALSLFMGGGSSISFVPKRQRSKNISHPLYNAWIALGRSANTGAHI